MLERNYWQNFVNNVMNLDLKDSYFSREENKNLEMHSFVLSTYGNSGKVHCLHSVIC